LSLDILAFFSTIVSPFLYYILLIKNIAKLGEKKVEKKVEFELKYSAIYRIWQKEKTLEISVFLMY